MSTAQHPLMPKATAVWLVDNTALSFRQIADFCKLHELEVKGIADGEVAVGIKGMDPISSGQLTRDEIQRGTEDPKYRLKLSEPKVEIPVVTPTPAPTPSPPVRSWMKATSRAGRGMGGVRVVSKGAPPASSETR